MGTSYFRFLFAFKRKLLYPPLGVLEYREREDAEEVSSASAREGLAASGKLSDRQQTFARCRLETGARPVGYKRLPLRTLCAYQTRDSFPGIAIAPDFGTDHPGISAGR
jgi:hypothetical protein